MSNQFRELDKILDKKIEKKKIYDIESAWDTFQKSVPPINIPPDKIVRVQIQWIKEVFQRGYAYGTENGLVLGRQMERNNEWRRLRELRAFTDDDIKNVDT